MGTVRPNGLIPVRSNSLARPKGKANTTLQICQRSQVSRRSFITAYLIRSSPNHFKFSPFSHRTVKLRIAVLNRYRELLWSPAVNAANTDVSLTTSSRRDLYLLRLFTQQRDLFPRYLFHLIFIYSILLYWIRGFYFHLSCFFSKHLAILVNWCDLELFLASSLGFEISFLHILQLMFAPKLVS